MQYLSKKGDLFYEIFIEIHDMIKTFIGGKFMNNIKEKSKVIFENIKHFDNFGTEY